MPRSWHGSIGSAARPRSWRRSGRRSDASSPILCWLRWCASLRRSCKRRSTVLFRLVCCSGRVARRTRPTCSSMHWYGTLLTARCCASRDVRFMPESPKHSKVSSQRSPRISPSCWHVTAPRRGRSRKPQHFGAKPHGIVVATDRGRRRGASASGSRDYVLRSCRARPLATRFGQDIGAATLSWKSLGFWSLGYPEAALADSEHALKVAREIGHSATLMYVLNFSAWTHILCGNYGAANALVDEFSGLKDQTGSLFWGAWGMMQRGCLLALTGKASDAVQTITCGLTAMRSTGTTMWMPLWLSHLTRANAEIGQFDDARRCIGEAMAAVETAKERWCEAEVNRITHARAGGGESGRVSRARARDCEGAAGEVLGIARRDKHGAAVGLSRH